MMTIPPPRETFAARVRRRASWVVRDRWPDRPVTRSVQGVTMVLPWSHRLPDYAKASPEYGQNLPRLAAAIAAADGTPRSVLDIGANVGDSALQILHAVDGRVLCVEGDRYFLDYLHRNVDGDARIVIEEALLREDDDATGMTMAPVRVGGTTRFAPGDPTQTAPTISMTGLRDKHTEFADLRLVKSDTDGYDVTLVPGVARAWAQSRPVLFFEYDHKLSRLAGNDPLKVWEELWESGYRHVGIWDNGGQPIGFRGLDEVAGSTQDLDRETGRRAHRYWDIAAVHGDDETGTRAVRSMFATD